MKVLWFEVTTPKAYDPAKTPIAGWQDSLQFLVCNQTDIELGIAFESSEDVPTKTIDGVQYFPIYNHYNFLERQKNKYSWDLQIKKNIAKAIRIIEEFKPDIIHVFGSEWCFGLVAKHTSIPVVIHMQGSIPPYYNASLPPKYNESDVRRAIGKNPIKRFNFNLSKKNEISRLKMEEEILRTVNNYMGRTHWDNNIVKLYNPSCNYYYCSEALRPEFILNVKKWDKPNNKKFRIVTTGVTSFWKGTDTILKSANMMKKMGFDFEWILAGNIYPDVKRTIELKEGLKFDECNVHIAGFVQPEELVNLLLSSDVYVHTAYIDNSPNSLCEAQYLGLPIIATYVGGIPSLIEDGENGILIPANDPFSLTMEIINISKDDLLSEKFSKKGISTATERHNPDRIIQDLLSCYTKIMQINQHL